MDKKTLILAGVLIILIAFAYIYQGPLKKWQDSLGKPKNFLSGLAIDQINKIEFFRDNQTTILNKDGDQWKIAGEKDFYADSSLVNTLLAGLKTAAASGLEQVSGNQGRKKQFGLEPGVKLVLYDNSDKLADFIIGSLSSDYSGTYLSPGNSSMTYLVKTDLASLFGQTDWRDLTIFSVDKTKINKIRFQYPNREFSIEKKDGKWSGILPITFVVSQDKMDKILEIMSNLLAAKIPEQNFSGTGLDKHLIIVEATGDGIKNILMIGNANQEGDYYAKRGNSDNIYLITEANRNELDKTIGQLK